MKFELELNWKHFAIAIILFGAGTGIGYLINQATNTNTECPTELFLSETDLNTLGGLTWVGGECERRGLLPGTYWQTDEQNNPYSIPICTEAISQ